METGKEKYWVVLLVVHLKNGRPEDKYGQVEGMVGEGVGCGSSVPRLGQSPWTLTEDRERRDGVRGKVE